MLWEILVCRHIVCRHKGRWARATPTAADVWRGSVPFPAGAPVGHMPSGGMKICRGLGSVILHENRISFVSFSIHHTMEGTQPWYGGGGGGGLCKLEFLQFKFCTKILYAICSVFSRICAGNNSKRPLFLMSNYWEPYIICSLSVKKWHRFCRARICRFIFSPARKPPSAPVPYFCLA